MAVANKIRKKGLDDYALRQRPNTKWKSVFVTNVVFDVYITTYTLGKGNSVKLPNWLKQKKSILLQKRDSMIPCVHSGV